MKKTFATILLVSALSLTACSSTPPSLALTISDTERQHSAHWYAHFGTLSQQAVWTNIRSGNGGTVRAGQEFTDSDGRSCRTFEETNRSTDGRAETLTGTACATSDGLLDLRYDSREG